MNKEYWKHLLYKAGFAAFYGAVAEFSVTGNFSQETLYVAVVIAGLRGLIVFITTIQDEFKRTTSASYGMKKKDWRNLL